MATKSESKVHKLDQKILEKKEEGNLMLGGPHHQQQQM